ncbi:DivIVA domain-containing protein [Streptomyces sp. NPDC014735]|uniref:DivIVA domain-containing protein n=1 Tax=unclassified Streptomyces TaxID=2593676 RepID=UPI0036F9F8A2
MRRRRVAGIAFGALLIVTSAPIVALAVDSFPVWALIVCLVAAALIGRKCYRLIWVDDLGDFGTPGNEVLSADKISEKCVEVTAIRTLIVDRKFPEGRFSIGYRRSDVDEFFDRVSSYLAATGPGISVSWIRRKQFPWAIREAGYRQEDVDALLRRIANELEGIVKSGRGR